MSDTDPITVYADYVCPFCYLGRRSLDTYQDERADPLDIDWRPFDLQSHKRGPDGDIDHSVEDGKDEEYFEQAWQNVERLREQYGVEMVGFEDIPREVDSFPAQVASWYVRETHPEQWLDFDEALYEAVWVEARDIEDTEVLASIAEDVGLDGAEIREAVRNEDIREEVREQFDAAQRQRITGVPTFVYGEHAARGAVPPEHLQRLVEGA